MTPRQPTRSVARKILGGAPVFSGSVAYVGCVTDWQQETRGPFIFSS